MLKVSEKADFKFLEVLHVLTAKCRSFLRLNMNKHDQNCENLSKESTKNRSESVIIIGNEHETKVKTVAEIVNRCDKLTRLVAFNIVCVVTQIRVNRHLENKERHKNLDN